ncbi:hypothetical protein HJG60_008451 [Phyllostomus discolor]|uniref:Uncharacterized protein n=1 Tax=Phyllostomus discolor TaxID=89673 RepID=A0A834DM95_9CHIR|nr:hypothetical protein HJG60_008451 [Phyllostomus discolor]
MQESVSRTILYTPHNHVHFSLEKIRTVFQERVDRIRGKTPGPQGPRGRGGVVSVHSTGRTSAGTEGWLCWLDFGFAQRCPQDVLRSLCVTRKRTPARDVTDFLKKTKELHRSKNPLFLCKIPSPRATINDIKSLLMVRVCDVNQDPHNPVLHSVLLGK